MNNLKTLNSFYTELKCCSLNFQVPAYLQTVCKMEDEFRKGKKNDFGFKICVLTYEQKSTKEKLH